MTPPGMTAGSARERAWQREQGQHRAAECTAEAARLGAELWRRLESYEREVPRDAAGTSVLDLLSDALMEWEAEAAAARRAAAEAG